MFESSIILVGTITTLVYFQFGAKTTAAGSRRGNLNRFLSWIEQVFVAITFGTLFAGIFAAAMTALIERISFLWTFLASIF